MFLRSKPPEKARLIYFICPFI